MTEHRDQTVTASADSESISPGDPRYAYAMTTAALHPVIAGSLDQLDAPTPCTEFSVRQLLDHVVMVQQRVAVIGHGGDFSTINSPELDGGWDDAFEAASQDVRKAWTDGAKLDQMFTVPWGQAPGGPLLMMYTAELATHGWDLATATGQDFHVDDEHLHGALAAARFVPAEGRDSPDLPFGPVVDVRDDASVLDQIVGWMGRQVS